MHLCIKMRGCFISVILCLKSGLRIRIRIVFGIWIWIRIRVKSWIWIQIQELNRLKAEPWGPGAHNGGVVAQYEALGDLYTSGRKFASLLLVAGSGSALN
jgi:hypothetical protein